MKIKNNTKTSKRGIVTVAEAKKSEKKRSTVAPNIQYDRVTQKAPTSYIVISGGVPLFFSCMVITCLIAAFTVGILLALALPSWVLVVIQSLLIMTLVCFIIKPRRR